VTEATGRRVLIVGCGYVGERVAALERVAGAHVSALARRPESAARLRALGIEPVSGDLDEPASLRAIPASGTDLYYFAPPPMHKDVRVPREAGSRERPPPVGITDPRAATFIETLTGANTPRRIVLISTTGVYGDCGGEWVNEDWPVNPQADRAYRRLDAEKRFREFGEAHGIAVVILRVAGIYGPGRLPVERLTRREPVLREEESPWSNRIHVDDLAQACVAAMRRGRAGAVYHATDGHPSTMTDYFNRVADTVGLPRPPQVSRVVSRTRMNEGMLSYLAESKRLDNRRLREELGVELQYPDLVSGLAASVEPPREQPQEMKS
jgi:nucleoside-diphosphate-sugar epimerase